MHQIKISGIRFLSGAFLWKKINKLEEKIEQQGLTLIPIKLYFKNNKLKVELAVCRGKNNYDKRETIRERDIKRSIEKQIKNKY